MRYAIGIAAVLLFGGSGIAADQFFGKITKIDREKYRIAVLERDEIVTYTLQVYRQTEIFEVGEPKTPRTWKDLKEGQKVRVEWTPDRFGARTGGAKVIAIFE